MQFRNYLCSKKFMLKKCVQKKICSKNKYVPSTFLWAKITSAKMSESIPWPAGASGESTLNDLYVVIVFFNPVKLF